MSFASPAAAIGVVATITINAAARVSITITCAIAASHTSRPIRPSTVAVAASVMSLGSIGVHGCHAPQLVTFIRDSISARVRPEQAAVTATV